MIDNSTFINCSSSEYGGSVYDEMRRTIFEIWMGRNFDGAWIAMSK